jgi:hypothetical protein
MLNVISKYAPNSNFDRVLFFFFYAKIISIFLPLEFNNVEFREYFKISHNFILAILLFTWVAIEINKPNSGVKLWTILTILVPASFIMLIVCFFIVLMPCMTEEGRELYKEKSGNGKIIVRLLNCGATTDYSREVYYITPITPLFNFIWKTDTTKIDKNDYVKIPIKNTLYGN